MPDLPYDPKRPEDFQFLLIGEMSKEDLIAELLSHQRVRFGEMDIPHLRALVIDARMQAFHERLITEAKLQRSGSPFGGYVSTDEDDSEGGSGVGPRQF